MDPQPLFLSCGAWCLNLAGRTTTPVLGTQEDRPANIALAIGKLGFGV